VTRGRGQSLPRVICRLTGRPAGQSWSSTGAALSARRRLLRYTSLRWRRRRRPGGHWPRSAGRAKGARRTQAEPGQGPANLVERAVMAPWKLPKQFHYPRLRAPFRAAWSSRCRFAAGSCTPSSTIWAATIVCATVILGLG
jgi:hypothetical protein